MKIQICLFVLIVCVCCVSCNNTLDINAPYRENTFVYGLLNAKDSVHYLRVHRGFLPDPDKGTNALEAAKIPDSSQYKPGQISVALFSQRSNNPKIKIADLQYRLITTSSASKDFAPNTVIYTTPKIGPLDTTQTYFVEIKKKDGEIITAQTPLIGSFETVFPFKGSNYVLNLRNTFRMERQPNAEVYKAVIRIEYQEFVSSTNTSTIKNLEFNVLPQTTSTSGALVGASGLRDFLLSSINPANDASGLKRRILKTEMDVWLAGSPVARSIQASNSFSALSQQKAIYTNLTNGFGIFSTVSHRKIICRISVRDLQNDRDLLALKFVE